MQSRESGSGRTDINCEYSSADTGLERFRDPPNDVLEGDLEVDVSVVGI